MGYLRKKAKRDMLNELARLLETDPEDVPPECRFLLEVDHASLEGASLDRQACWILAVNAAKGAGRRVVSPKAGQRRPVRPRRKAPPARRRQRLYCTPRVKQSLGTLDVERAIERDHGTRTRRPRKHSRGSGDDLTTAANKRRKPD